MRLSSSRSTAIIHRPQQDFPLWDKAGTRPSLDLQFADRKDLVDATTGSNLVDFTRASSGTYVGSDGLIKTAVTNLVLRSEEFDDPAWAKTQTTIDPNAVTAPDGSTTADKATASGNDARVQQYPIIGIASGATLTASIWIKGEGTTVGKTGGISVATDSGLGTGANFTLTDDWQRVSVTRVTPVGDANGGIRIDLADPSAVNDVFYLWGAQLEQSTTVGEYVKTTSTINSAPRFDHDPTTGESLGLLVEESRTNYQRFSEDFSQGLTPLNASLTTNVEIAPDGNQAADQFLETTANGLHSQEIADFLFVLGTTYTFSCFAKSIGGRTFCPGFPTKFGTARFGRFSLTGAGSVLSADAGVTASIQAYPNGWYRCSITSTCTEGGGARVGVFIGSGTSISYVGDATKGLYLWGAQLEAGSFPTSYIPTTTAAVTRAADVASISGSNFSSWYRQDEGTVFADYDVGGGTQNRYSFAISDNTINNRIAAFNSGGSNLNFRIVNSGTSYNPGALTVNAVGASKICLVYAATTNGGAGASNGTLGSTSSPAALPTVDRLYIGLSQSGAEPLNGPVRRLVFWPRRLPDSTLQTITQ